MFTTPIDLTLKGNLFGPLASSADADSDEITLGIATNWLEAAKGRIDESIYAHEVGHLIPSVASGSPALPEFIKSHSESALLTEGLSDLFSIFHNGKISNPEQTGFPSCFSIREIRDFQSFDYPIGYFQKDFQIRRLSECCRAYEKQKSNRKNHWTEAACTQIQEFAKHLGPLNRKRFDLSDMESVGGDVHQVSIPVLSFLRDLQEKLGTGFYKELLTALNSAASVNSAYSCRLANHPRLVQVPRQGVVRFFEALRKRLKSDQKVVFDRTWARHGMAIGMAIDERENAESDSVRGRAAQHFAEILNTEASAHLCLSALKSRSFDSAGCEVECVSDPL